MVEVRLNTKGTRAATQQAIEAVLKRLAAETASGAQAHARRKSGFMASTVGHTAPGQAGAPARDEQTPDGPRHAAATPAAGRDTAIAYVAATYALFVELKHPFLLPAAQQALADLGRILAEEGL